MMYSAVLILSIIAAGTEMLFYVLYKHISYVTDNQPCQSKAKQTFYIYFFLFIKCIIFYYLIKGIHFFVIHIFLINK